MSGKFMDIGIPANIKIRRNFQRLQIIRRWFHIKYIFLTLFVVFWDAFLINWYAMAFSSFSSSNHIDIAFLLFPLLHVAVGIGLSYYVLVGYLNKTTINIDFNAISIKHGPLPVWDNKTVPSRQLKQLYSKKYRPLTNRRGYSYAVHAITSDATTGSWRNIKLLSGLDTSEQALFIEQEIEKFLKITDLPVKGELR